MNNHSNTINFAPVESTRAATQFGLWLRAGYVGVLLVLVGCATLVSTNASIAWGVAWVIGGVALAAISWRRADAAFAELDAPAATTRASAKRVAYSTSADPVLG